MCLFGSHAEKIRIGSSKKYEFILFKFVFWVKWCEMYKWGPYLSYSNTKSWY